MIQYFNIKIKWAINSLGIDLLIVLSKAILVGGEYKNVRNQNVILVLQ